MGCSMWRHFCRDEGGATSIEYAIMGSMFALMCVVAYAAAGEAVNDLFEQMSTSVVSAGEGGGGGPGP